jgi:amino acid adenylation domain-containing protein
MTIESAGADERALLAELLRRDGFIVPASDAPTRRPVSVPRYAGAPQRRLWIQERIEETPGLNTLHCLVRFGRAISEPALKSAIAALFQRHEALRTHFEETADGLIERIEQQEPPPIERIEGSPTDDAVLARATAQPLGMATGPTWRVALFTDPAAADRLLLAFHHAIIDWSGARSLMEELDRLLLAAASGIPANLPDEPLQQADHAYWWRADARRQQIERDRTYWQARFAGQSPELRFPAAMPREHLVGAGCMHVPIVFDDQMVQAIRGFATRSRSTPFFVFLAAFAGVLGRFALSEDVSIGTTVGNRGTPGGENIVGCLSDLVVLRCDLAGGPGFASLVARLHQACSKDLEHTALGYADVVELVRPQRRAGVAPLFQALFNLLPAARGAMPVLTPIPGSVARADIALELEDDGVSIGGRIEVREGLIPCSLALSITSAIGSLLRHGIAMPDRPVASLPLVEPAEAAEQTDRLNPPMPASPQETLGDLFVAQARRRPHDVALREGERSITYGALLARSTALAESLAGRGLAPGAPVAIGLERSIDLAVAALAVMRAGGAALLLNPEYPADRLAGILADSGAPFLIARRRPAWLPMGIGCALISPAADGPTGGLTLPRLNADDPAYVVYTSGSTGHPKGVVGLHRGMVNRLRWMEKAFPFEADDIACLKTSPAFVDFVAELFGPLLAGAPSVIADEATAHDPMELTGLIRQREVTRIVLVPSLLRAWLDMVPDLGQRLGRLRLCVCSGEALPAALARRFRSVAPECRLMNLYGSSEVSADAAWHEVMGDDRDPIPIGRPIPGNRIAVVDGEGHALPIGAPGEIAIAGHGVSGGYLHDEAGTAERFSEVTALAGHGRAFRTGDLGYWNGESRLVYLGRLDRQVKIQGVRVEPREVERAIESHTAVRACHVVDSDGRDVDTRVLVAYVVVNAGVSTGDLRAFLTSRLPRALIPASFVFLDALPLGPSGKIDRTALPSPPKGDEPTAGRRTALGPLEAVIAAVWSDVLGRPVEADDADFFACGGGSLQAIVAMTRLNEVLGTPVSVATLFETPVLGELARRLAAPDGDALPPPVPSCEPGPPPATSNQFWLWKAYRDDPDGTAYNLSVAYRLAGPLDRTALGAAFRDLLARHGALRTRLSRRGEDLVQQIDDVPAVVLREADLSAAADPDVALSAALAAAEQRPFALDCELPFRAELVHLGPDRHGLILTVHHVASDGWSGRILAEDLSALYDAHRGQATQPPMPGLQLGDIARWQQRVRPMLVGHIEEYRRTLAGAEAPRLAGVKTGVPAGGPTAIAPIAVAPDILARHDQLARELHASRFVMMLAAWAALLARFGGVERPLVGFPQAGRNVPGLQSVVGFLANTVLISPDLRDAPTFRQVVEATRQGLVAALRHQDVPLAWIEASGAGWSSGTEGEAVRAMVIVEDTADWDLSLTGVEARLIGPPHSPQARVDLALLVSETDRGPDIRIEYAMRRIPTALADRLARGFARLLCEAAAGPDTRLDRLPLLGPDGDDASVIYAAPSPAPAAHRLDGLLAHAAASRPKACAASDLRTEMSYGELQAQACGVAEALRAAGAAPGDRVGLVAGRSPRQLAALFGIWRAGATAVVLDPIYPRDRIAWTLADAAVVAILSDMPFDYPCVRLPLDARTPAPVPVAVEQGDGPAAIVYTSGTTGQPKGVPVGHAALCRLGAALADAYGLGDGDRVLQVVSPAFDVALSDIALTLAGGATLIVPSIEAVMPGRTLTETLARGAITHVQVPAAVLAATRPVPLPALRMVAVGGEVCPPETARQWAEGRTLFVVYGPSEATVTAALAPYDGNSRPGTIGRPFCGASLAVVDAAGVPVPPGVAGELAIGGAGVATGYFRRPELTTEKFGPDPYGRAGERRYRTGDRARLETDGTVTFLGRIDRQLKLRGFRIEPGEIEAAMAALPGVTRALVAARGEGTADRRLVAWVVAEAGTQLDGQDLRRDLRRRLPDHLIPDAVLEIANVPLTPNGKIDWDALVIPAGVAEPSAAGSPAAVPEAGRRPPADEAAIRRHLGELWEDLLPGRPQIGLDQSFFDIGGHSFLVVRMQERLEARYGTAVPIGELFANPTIRTLASMLHRRLVAAPETETMEEFVL